MESLEELKRHLLCDDDQRVYTALRRYFRPVTRLLDPLAFDWVPMPDLQVVLGGQPGGGVYEAAARQAIDLANAADAALRERRFARRRRDNPDAPVVVCEGDSWISHPFVHDLGDHLFDDELRCFCVLNRGAAGDRLATMEKEREHEAAIGEFSPVAMVLSGGGNDLLVQFDEFLPAERAPERLVTDALDARVEALMGVMRQVLEGVRACDATLPVLVHGYDYMPIAEPGKGKFLGPYFDRAGIEGDRRQATLNFVVDRFNQILAETVGQIPHVTYVDVRNTVPRGEWYDEIHPNAKGFARVAKVIGAHVRTQARAG